MVNNLDKSLGEKNVVELFAFPREVEDRFRFHIETSEELDPYFLDRQTGDHTIHYIHHGQPGPGFHITRFKLELDEHQGARLFFSKKDQSNKEINGIRSYLFERGYISRGID